MKRICLIPALIALLFCLTACGTGAAEPKADPITTPVGDVAEPILPEPEVIPEREELRAEQEEPPAEQSAPQMPAQRDDYLSSVGSSESQIHTTQPLSPQTPDAPTPEQSPVQTDNYLTQGQTGDSAVYGTTQRADDSTTEPIQTQPDDYLSGTATDSGRVYSTTTGGGKDRYQTDPVPVGKPLPTEPQNQQVDTRKKYTCTFAIECATILNNLPQLAPEKLGMVPSNGVILPKQTVTFYEGESVFDVLQRLCRDKGIHMESSWTPIYNSAYIEGIQNLYEFDCGNLSGWMYRVNGWYPNYGCSRYQLAQGDVVEWRYTCDLGKDIGGGNAW